MQRTSEINEEKPSNYLQKTVPNEHLKKEESVVLDNFAGIFCRKHMREIENGDVRFSAMVLGEFEIRNFVIRDDIGHLLGIVLQSVIVDVARVQQQLGVLGVLVMVNPGLPVATRFSPA